MRYSSCLPFSPLTHATNLSIKDNTMSLLEEIRRTIARLSTTAMKQPPSLRDIRLHASQLNAQLDRATANVNLHRAKKKRKLAPHANVSPATFYTDGSALSNGRKGARAGWGVVCTDGREWCGKVEGRQTNNRAELTAMSIALTKAAAIADVTIITDSTHVRNGMNRWIADWKSRNWRLKSRNAAPVNCDLWRDIDTQMNARQVPATIKWVKAHAGCAGNERADALAKTAAQSSTH